MPLKVDARSDFGIYAYFWKGPTSLFSEACVLQVLEKDDANRRGEKVIRQ